MGKQYQQVGILVPVEVYARMKKRKKLLNYSRIATEAFERELGRLEQKQPSFVVEINGLEATLVAAGKPRTNRNRSPRKEN